MTTTPEASRLAKCHECGMFCQSGEFHPFAACLMFMGCHDSDKVRANLAALSQPDEARDARWQPMDTVPKDGTPILVWLPEPMLNSHVHAATYHPNVVCIGGVFAFDATSQPTGWMPQPAAMSKEQP